MGTIEFLYDYPSVNDTEGPSSYQRDYQQKIKMFLKGDCSQEIKDSLTSRILDVIRLNPESDWVIGFIPAPDVISTIMRYGELALELGEKTDCRVYLDLFEPTISQDDILCKVNIERVLGKSIILIDSLFASGQRYSIFQNKIIEAGAKEVYGIIIAKTS